MPGQETARSGQSDQLLRRAIADELRALSAMVMLSTTTMEELETSLGVLRDSRERLSASYRRGRYEGLPGLAPGSPANELIWETHGAFGPSNPLAPPVRVEEDEGTVAGTVTFGAAWEGGPGTVYGGFIAAAFDGVLGRAVMSAGHVAVTKVLTVRFMRPTPLDTELRIESFAEARRDREVAVHGGLWLGPTQTCQADATFVCVDASRYRAP